MKKDDKNSQKGLAPIVVLVIGAVVALTVLKPLPKTTAPTKTVTVTTKPTTTNSTPDSVKVVTDTKAAQQKLEKYITVEAALLGVSDNISLYYKDLNHSKEFSIEPTKSWIPASTIKSYVVLEAFRQRGLGLINFDQEVVVKAANVVPTELETDEFPRLREGTKATIKQLVEAMVTQSDNTAYNTLLDILDRRNINLALKNIGLTETIVGEKLNLDGGQFQADLQVAGRQPNTTTAKDLATFFDLLYNKKIANSEEILDIFKRQKINNMIPALLPNSTEIAHKTGDWAPIYHDGGVVFRQDDPFILTVFTNSGDPSIIAKLARVAYFQTADSVGKTITLSNPPVKHLTNSPYEKIALNEAVDTSVLGETSDTTKFPTVTAADLGINQQDLSVSPKAASNLRSAFITPGSLLYGIKNFFRSKQLQGDTTNSQKAKTYLDISKDKLTEVKSLMEKGDVEGIQTLLDESEQNLAKATELSKNDPGKDLLLVQIKQVNDLHFAVLNEKAAQLPDNDKEKFIDTVYNFYQKNNQEITPVVNTSVIANVTQQKPAVGTVTEVKDNTATIQFDDGTKKDVILNDGTKVRSFQQENYQDTSNIVTGDKIAVVGITNNDSKIVPEFILRDIPQELPSKHTGTIIEIKPDENTLKILNNQGQEENIKIDTNTSVQSKDTTVSLDGIKAGSQVTIFGTSKDITPQGSSPFNITLPFFGNVSLPSPSPSISPTPTTTIKPSVTPQISPTIKPATTNSSPSITPITTQSDSKSVQPTITPTQTSSTTNSKNTPTPTPTVKSTPVPVTPTSAPVKATTELKATSITVTTNSSGKNEVTTNKTSTSQPVSTPAPTAAPKASTPAPTAAPQPEKRDNPPATSTPAPTVAPTTVPTAVIKK